jgi:hypothetical protein
LLSGGQRPAVTNSYGGELAFRISNKITLTGFAEETNARILGRGDANIWSYGIGLAFPDFGKKGNVLGLFAGVEPTLRVYVLMVLAEILVVVMKPITLKVLQVPGI